MTFDEYQAIDAVNFSTLKHMMTSPLHYHYNLTAPRADNPRMAMGRAAHLAVLEPDRFTGGVTVWTGGIRRGKEWDAFKAQYASTIILTKEEYDQVQGMADAVRHHPAVKPLFARGTAEQVVQWEREGVKCKARVDWIGDAIADLKTSNDIAPHRFKAMATRMNYHCQGAWYQTGYAATSGRVLPVTLIAVEQDPPWDVIVYPYTEDALYRGEQKNQAALQRLKECRSSGQWPGRSSEPIDLDVAPWDWDQGEDDDER